MSIKTRTSGVHVSVDVLTSSGNYASGLINSWPMTDAQVSGTTVTDIIAANNGTEVGGTITSAAGPPYPGNNSYPQGRADDAASYISAASSPLDWNANSFTIAFWAFVVNVAAPLESGARATFFMNTRVADNAHFVRVCYGPGVAPNGQVILAVSGTGIISTTQQLFNNTWAHVACTNQGGGSTGILNIFINGLMVQTSPLSGEADSAILETVLMARSSTPDGRINGRMAALKIWNRALTAADILALYLAGG